MVAKATNPVPSEIYSKLKGSMAKLKNFLDGQITVSARRRNDYYLIYGVYAALLRWRDYYNSVRDVPGLQQYARSNAAENDPAYSIVGECDAIRAIVETTMGHINSTVPTSVDVATPENSGATPLITTDFPASNAQIVQFRLYMQAISDLIS